MPSRINSNILNRMIITSLYNFLETDYYLIITDVSERCLCGRLAIYFEKILRLYNFGPYFADVEYNREQEGRIKSLIDDEYKVIKITTDLIIHSRGILPGKDNIIAIEMAKQNKCNKDMESDKKRLRALTKHTNVWPYGSDIHPEYVCGYLRGLYLIIDHESEIMKIETYSGGEIKLPIITLSIHPLKNTPLNPHYYKRYKRIMAAALHASQKNGSGFKIGLSSTASHQLRQRLCASSYS